MADPIPLSRPDLDDADRAAVARVLAGDTLSRGPFVEAFEREAAALAGRREAVAVSSGTAALHLASVLSGLGPGDEVVTTPFSFIASANVVLYAGAIPRFVDVDPDTLNLEVDAVEAAIGPRTRAILAVHALGRPCAIERLEALARERGLRLIEDACEAIGGTVGGRALGGFGDFGTFAFYPNKQVTCGEGGVLLTDDADAARAARMLRNQGRDPDGDGYPLLGFNYRLTDIQAALASSQLRRLSEILERRRRVAAGYRERLAGVEALVLPDVAPSSSWFVYVVRLRDDLDAGRRDAVIDRLRASAIGCARYFEPIHLQPVYRERFRHAPGAFPVTERAAARTIALPFFNGLTGSQQDRVVECLVRALG